MKIISTILIVIAAIIALLLIVALFTKKDYAVEREIVIDKPKQAVFDYLKHIKNQDYYNKWVMVDPQMKKEFRGTDGTAGFVYAWNGNKRAGEGEQEIIRIVDGEKIEAELRFKRPFEGLAQAPFTTQAVSENKTKVTWGMSSSMKYPMNIMLLFINMDNMLGKDMEESLGMLKNNLEK